MAAWPHPGSISVVVPSFNDVEHIGDALTSIINQTEPPAEIVVSDDGSDDGTEQFMRELVARNERAVEIRYVRLAGTAAYNVNSITVPGIVYWKDNTFGVVTPTMSECVSTKANCEAGFLVNPNATNGNFVFIQVGGYLGASSSPGVSPPVPASTAVDDSLYGATGAFTMTRDAAGTASKYRPAAFALQAVSGGLADIFVVLESMNN